MSKYIDAEKLIAEIERRKKCAESAKKEWVNEGYNQNAFAEDCRISSFEKLLDFITSLQQEQPEVDLEKEIEDCAIGMPHCEFSHDSECVEDEEWLKEKLRYFYELGLKAKGYEYEEESLECDIL